ncbi:MAG: DnaJ domain-containing protein [Candidatus Scalinduaceae bacterium]
MYCKYIKLYLRKRVSILINYYQVLEIHEGAKNEEIKNSFRKLVKKFHPDRQKTNGVCAEEKIKVLIQAYKTLTDSEKKSNYDRLLRFNHTTRYYKDRHDLEKDNSSLRDQLKKILSDLLNNKGAKALKNYESLREENKECDLPALLGLKDYVDCMFLLAEEYERQGSYELAFTWYEHVYNKEIGNPGRQYLREEMKDRIIRLSCKNLLKRVQPNLAITYLKKVLTLSLTKNEEALIYKKIADCQLTFGDWNGSMANFNKALSLCPNLKGTQKLREKLKNHFLQNNISYKFASCR